MEVARAALAQNTSVFININPHGSHLVLNNRREEPLKSTQALAKRKWQVKKAVRFPYLKLEGGGLQDIMKTVKGIRRGNCSHEDFSPDSNQLITINHLLRSVCIYLQWVLIRSATTGPEINEWHFRPNTKVLLRGRQLELLLQVLCCFLFICAGI